MATHDRLHRAATPYKHRFPHKGLLPEGHYYTLTWGIPLEFGGMTTVALERSSAFAKQDRRRVDILTLSPALRSGGREKELRAEGRISRGVRIRNIWADLSTWSDRKLRHVVGTVTKIDHPADDLLPRSTRSWTEMRRDSQGAVLQVDRFRDNGTLFVSDRQDMRKRGKRGGRRITLFDRKQKPIGQWSTARSFYHSWFDSVFHGKRTYMISDSSFVGGLVHNYRRDNVILCQVIHNHFLKDTRGDLLGELAPAKFEILSHLDSFDVVTTLTDQQRKDIFATYLSTNNLRTVSNPTHDLHGDVNAVRNPLRGAMIARLVYQKRVEDAVRAVFLASKIEPGLKLDIYGEGRDRAQLTSLREELGVTESVVLHGHTPGAKKSFLTTSFSLLTSRFEGQGLAVLESMSAGCIPIAYDIPYGPSDIISHGINGFLVPGGDVEALASTVVEVMAMSEDELRPMRQAAIERAANFFERPVVSRWGDFLAEQTFESLQSYRGVSAQLTAATVTEKTIEMAVNVSETERQKPSAAYVVWKSRVGNHFGRWIGSVEDNVFRASVPTHRFANIPPGLVDLSLDLINGRNCARVRISADINNIENLAKTLSLYATIHGSLSARVIDLEMI